MASESGCTADGPADPRPCTSRALLREVLHLVCPAWHCRRFPFVSGIVMAENKTKPTTVSVDDFIAAIDHPRRRADAQTALALYRDVTSMPPVMWGPSIIGFGVHRHVYQSGRERLTPAACFSPRKANMTFYVGDAFEGAGELFATLGKHRKSVACLYVSKLDDVDVKVLREIITRQYVRICAKTS